jgi:phytol kinase
MLLVFESSLFLLSFLPRMLQYFSVLGFLHLDWNKATIKVALISFVATFVESLPITDVLDDNISVPIASMCTALAVFGSGSN